MPYSSYKKRLIVILSHIVKCCGEVQWDRSVCAECEVRILKCSRLMKRSQISMLHYVKLVREAIMAESDESDGSGI